MSDNLRREVRVDARVEILVVRGKRTVSLETADVSYKGLFLRTGDPPAVRSLLRLRVVLPMGHIEAHAMVVHVTPTSPTDNASGDAPESSRGAGVGLQFWGLAGPDRLVWDEFVKKLIQAKRESARKMTPSVPPPESEPTFGAQSTPSGVRVAPNLAHLAQKVSAK